MSVLFLSTDPETLAGKLADAVDQQMRGGDCFAPVTVVVPNRYLAKWLRLFLARRLGVICNLRFLYLEAALWEWFRALDPRTHAAPPEHLDPDAYRYLVLHVLLHERDEHLDLLRHYLEMRDEQALSRLSCRRAWALAERMGGFIRDYEYHRQYLLIRPWLRGEQGLDPQSYLASLERSQRALFTHITKLPEGRRERLIVSTGRLFKTLPQYGNEVMEQMEHQPAAKGAMHLFGITQISAWHVEAIRWLGIHLDLQFYHLNPLVARLSGQPNLVNLQGMARSWAQDKRAPDNQPGSELLHLWGRAGAESLGLISEFLTSTSFHADVLSSTLWRGRRSSKAPVLTRLQEHLVLPHRAQEGVRVPQDLSLQIVGCPGILREVETVHNSILKNLHDHPEMRQTDIVVLVTDMKLYRPYLQTVFERPPRALSYNLIDFSAAGLSRFGQALIGMFDLALDAFTRSKVFEVLLNPCFLARLGIDHQRALAWVNWAEALGIHQGWDAREKASQGRPESALYSWRLGLQRLRLGRYMEIASEERDGAAPHFQDIIPFADLDSSDQELLDGFIQAVEGLLPALDRLRTFQGSARQWAETIRRLATTFLDVPEEWPQEAQVRDRLLESLETFGLWDNLGAAGEAPATLPLALVREILYGRLETIEGSHGEYLTGGVTLSALQPMRPVPFAIVYVLGLGEQHFPGSMFLSPLDLRNHERQPGDIRPAEHQRYLFLEAILSARKKLYLFWNNKDLKEDKDLLPAVPIQQLQRYLTRHLLSAPFEPTIVPLSGHDAVYISELERARAQDVLVQYRTLDRLLAIHQVHEEKRVALDLNQRAELQEKMKEVAPDFTLPAPRTPSEPHVPTVSAHVLQQFLYDPAEAQLKRHLHLDDGEESEMVDTEPVVSSKRLGARLIRQVLEEIVMQSALGRAEEVLREWPERFEARYDDWRLRCRVPEQGFAEVDRQALRIELKDRLDRGLSEFLRQRRQKHFCGPILMGESFKPINARVHLPALDLLMTRRLPHLNTSGVRLVGDLPLAWTDADSLETLLFSGASKFRADRLNSAILEPALMYLMLLANDEPGPEGWSGREWLLPRTFRIHVALPEGVRTVEYPAKLIRPAEARDYLAALATDYLDPASCEILPFTLLSEERLRGAYEGLEDTNQAEAYADTLRDLYAGAVHNTFMPDRISALVRPIDLTVPDDAYDKARRRFALLDRGPGRERRRDAVLGAGMDDDTEDFLP